MSERVSTYLFARSESSPKVHQGFDCVERLVPGDVICEVLSILEKFVLLLWQVWIVIQSSKTSVSARATNEPTSI